MVTNGYIPKNNERRIIKRFALFPIEEMAKFIDDYFDKVFSYVE